MALILSVAALVIYLIVVYIILKRRDKGKSKRSNIDDDNIDNEITDNEDDLTLEYSDNLKNNTKQELQKRLIDTFRAIQQFENEKYETSQLKNNVPDKLETKRDLISEINHKANQLLATEDESGTKDSTEDMEVQEIEWITDTEIDF